MDLQQMLDSLDGDDLGMESLLNGSYLDELETIEPESTHPNL
jgi:hypothetical protein